MNKPRYGILAEHIDKRYRKKQVLYDVSLAVPYGKIYGLLGPSGCGKTTLVKILSGILRPEGGHTFILGKQMPSLDTMGSIGYMAQSAALYKTLTGYENLKFFGSLYGLSKKELHQRILYAAGLVNLEQELKKKAGEYSGGMRQRLSLAAALLPNPSVLLLDEPTVGIDPILRRDIWRELHHLSDQGITILVTTHVMDEAQKCHFLGMMRRGRILSEGTPDQLQKLANASTLEEAFLHFSNMETAEDGGAEHEN